jgi:hypothetical protein
MTSVQEEVVAEAWAASTPDLGEGRRRTQQGCAHTFPAPRRTRWLCLCSSVMETAAATTLTSLGNVSSF